MYHFVPMTESVAKTISSWTYPPPYDLYTMDGSEECIQEFMNGEYFYVEDEGFQLVGFVCSGCSARVPGGYEIGVYDNEDLLDIGLGLRPDLTGQGLGGGFLMQAVSFLGSYFGKSNFRLVVAASNERAIKAYGKAGFVPGEGFYSSVSDVQIPFVVMRLYLLRTENLCTQTEN
ncbi:GNAT family N-acetyltransferase [Paenibacillus koleovorans]|uniref:GNAT family N-acetyltransferase n=1 Tax=Paenibacillus koleovorans TaxID=121608 RepID=UPI000FDB95E7|nr:GNAT family protein [Paenibacillus koleovorans]